MSMLTRRLQALIDEERHQRLELEAARRGVAVAVLVREALDAAFPGTAGAPCRALVAALRDGLVRVTTTPEVIQEFAHVRSRRRSRQDAAELAEQFAALLRPLIVVVESDLWRGLAVFAADPRLGVFDAVLAAAAMHRDARALVSADQAFAAVDGLSYVDPGEPGLIATLTA